VRLLADAYAQGGGPTNVTLWVETIPDCVILASLKSSAANARSYVIDFFKGEAAPTDPEERAKWDLGGFVSRHPPREGAWPIVESAAKEIRQKHKKLGVCAFSSSEGFSGLTQML
jgi:hypothetical protein